MTTRPLLHAQPMHRPGHCLLDLTGVPQIPEDAHRNIIGGVHGRLTDEQIRRSDEAIEAACWVIKNRLFDAWREKPKVEVDYGDDE
jgi:hypothetical protein